MLKKLLINHIYRQKIKNIGRKGSIHKSFIIPFFQALRSNYYRLLYSIFQTFRMSFLLYIFSRTLSSTPSATVEKMIHYFESDSLDPLPDHYIQTIIENTSNHFKIEEIFRQFVIHLGKVTSVPALIKVFTIVFGLLRKFSYKQSFLEEIQQIQLKNSSQFDDSECKWIKQLSRSLVTYIGRMPSCGDVFRRLINFRTQPIGDQNMQLDIFRMTNLYSLVFPFANNATNTVGRYYKKNYLFYQQFHKVLRDQLKLGYDYMRYICDRFTKLYPHIEISIIRSFYSIIPEIELLCDEMEEYVVSKYYKGKGIGKKLYFQEEKIKEIQFYLENQQYLVSQEKEGEMFDTAESDFFGNAPVTL